MLIKICGLSDAACVAAAAEAGARYVGFVFFPQILMSMGGRQRAGRAATSSSN
ncbi:MAG: hypothetical protein AAFW98_14045 [Pseudomonadota bacterium]